MRGGAPVPGDIFGCHNWVEKGVAEVRDAALKSLHH